MLSAYLERVGKECSTFEPLMSQQSIARLYEYVFWAGSQAGHWWSRRGNHRTVEMIRGLVAALSKVDQMVVAEAAARISRCWQFFPRESPNLLSTPACETSTFLSLWSGTMDPLSTLSLAGNVIQFVDFGSKLISQGYELYKSSNGQLAVDEELELVTSDLRDVILRIQGATVITPLHPSTSAMIDSSSSYSTPFARICVEAVEVAQVILNKLDGFKIDSNIKSSKSRKLETFHQILKRLWSKNELDQLQERLKTLKDEIDRAVLVAML
jgi:hypothetical protein